MTRTCLSFVCLALFTLTAGCAQAQTAEPKEEKAPEIKTFEQKAGYAFGMEIGQTLKQMKSELDLDALVRGMLDAANGKKLALTEEEALTIKRAFGAKMQEKADAKQKEEAAENEKAGKAYRDEFAKKEGVKKTESGLLYRVITEGKGDSPKADDSVRVHYKGALIDGTEFDSSFKRGRPETFKVGELIPGFSEALQLMKVDGKYEFVIPPDLGYGVQGAGQAIGPNATLVFEILLVKIEPK